MILYLIDIMRITKSQYNSGYQFGRGEEEKIPNAGAFYCQAIENADGVPFQLIFGPQIGEGIYLISGAGITQLLGIAPEDFTEKLFYEMTEAIIPLSDDIPADPALSRRKFLKGEIKNYRADILVNTPQGQKKWIRDTSVPMIDEKTGNVIGALGILYDDNAQKLLLENLLKARQDGEESERMKASFLHNLSHEIRTPLNAIVGFSTLLKEYLDSPQKRTEYLDIISNSSDHLLQIIDDIVEITKIEAKTVKVSREKVNLISLLQTIYEQFRAMAAEKGVVLNYVVMPGSNAPDIYTDGYKVARVLRNLVSNALKFIHEGRVEFGYGNNGGKTEFWVSDTGIGIAPEQQSNIFSMFYQGDTTTKRIYGGTGLGLAIAKAYVELLGGEIWFTSRQGEGSVFRFTVPDERVGG
jgi:signal transduction histidine kinase